MSQLVKYEGAGEITSTPEQLVKTDNNTFVPDGCLRVNLSASGYLPWKNPDSIVSTEEVRLLVKVTQNVICVMFLIGGPANVINMAVFYKQGLQARVNLCLFALSLSDLLHLIIAVFFHGELFILQFSSKETQPFVLNFIVNNNLVGFFGFQWVAQVLTAIIASERCLCVLTPLKFQALLRTKTVGIVIITIYIVVVGLFFVVAFRHRVGCVYDAATGTVLRNMPIAGELYKAHKELVDYLSGVVFGWVLPGGVIIVVTTTTIITAIKLRQIVRWRGQISSSLSAGEVALTKMLIGNSIFFIVCVLPDAMFRIACVFLPEMNAGRRHQNLYMSFLWILDMIAFVNSSFNMFLFYAMGSRFRGTFWALFRRNVQLDK